MNDFDPKAKLTPKQVLLSLHVEADHDEALARSLDATDEELDAQLREAGIDPDDIDAPAQPAVVEAVPVDAPSGGGRFAVWLAAAAAAVTAFAGMGVLATGGVLAGSYAARPDAVDTHSPSPSQYANALAGTASPSSLDRARALRRDALAACDKKQWSDCTGRLDEAWRLDPAGENAPEIRAARALAAREIEEQESRAKQQ
jgi:hypothetical protein